VGKGKARQLSKTDAQQKTTRCDRAVVSFYCKRGEHRVAIKHVRTEGCGEKGICRETIRRFIKSLARYFDPPWGSIGVRGATAFRELN